MDNYGDGIPEATITLTNKVVGVKRVMLDQRRWHLLRCLR